MGGDCVDHEVDGGGERVVDVVGETEASTEFEVDEAMDRSSQRPHQRDHGRLVDTHLGEHRSDDAGWFGKGCSHFGVLFEGGCGQERVVQARVAAGERSQLLGDRPERLRRLEAFDTIGELGGEQAARVDAQLTSEPGETVDVTVERRRPDPECRSDRCETERVEAVAIRELGGRSDDVLAA